MQKLNQTIAKQKGVALIMLTAIVSLVILIFIVKNLDGKQFEALKKDKTAKALFEAKNALLGWTILRGASGAPSTATPGQLPCPEDLTLIGTPNEGNAMTSCSSTLPVVGRLPWRSLGLGDLRDGNGDKLWYAISTGFRDAPINTNTIGQLNIDGNLNATVAIIFSPGVISTGQNRPIPTSTSPPAIADYLDLSNNNGDASFTTTGSTATFNDVLITIKHTEFFQMVEKRILKEVRGDNTQGLVRFYATQGANNYPFADTNNDGIVNLGTLLGNPSYEGINGIDPDNLFFNTRVKNILTNNNWMQLINYQISPDRQTTTMTLNTQSIIVVP